MYVANNLSIIVFCFVLILLSIQLFILSCTYNIMYNLKKYVFIKYNARDKICIQLQLIFLK